METISWEEFLSNADNYFGRVQKNKSTYTPDLLYNLSAMAIENYFMALCVRFDKLPDNHRFSDLVEAASTISSIDPALIQSLKDMEAMQEICSLEAYSRKKCTPEDIPLFVATTESVKKFVAAKINKDNTLYK